MRKQTKTYVMVIAVVFSFLLQVDPVSSFPFESDSQSLVRANSKTDDDYGKSVAMDREGSIALISAPSANVATALRSGLVSVWKRGTLWQEVSTIDPPTPTSEHRFGWSVDISGNGDIAVISAIESLDVCACNGTVYLYSLSSGVPKFLQVLERTNHRFGEFFGQKVAISDDGNRIMVVADSDAGSRVFIYDKTGSGWILIKVTSDIFGWHRAFDMAQDGRSFIMTGSTSGQMFAVIYEQIDNEWVLQHRINGLTGRSSQVSMSGDGKSVFISDGGVEWVAPDRSTARGVVHSARKIGNVWVDQPQLKQEVGPWEENSEFAVDVASDFTGANIVVASDRSYMHFRLIDGQWNQERSRTGRTGSITFSRNSEILILGTTAFGGIELPKVFVPPQNNSPKLSSSIPTPTASMVERKFLKVPRAIAVKSGRRSASVSFSMVNGTTYRVVGRIGKTSKKFKCRSLGKKMTCVAPSLRKGVWTISIDSSRGSASSKTILKRVRIR